MAKPKRTIVKKKTAGRLWFDGRDQKEVLRKLEEAFAIGCTNREACLYADITEIMYYNYIKARPELTERFTILKEKPILKARSTVVKGLDQPEHAKWYLSRKSPEFREKSESASVNLNLNADVKMDPKSLALKEEYEKKLFEQLTQ